MAWVIECLSKIQIRLDSTRFDPIPWSNWSPRPPFGWPLHDDASNRQINLSMAKLVYQSIHTWINQSANPRLASKSATNGPQNWPPTPGYLRLNIDVQHFEKSSERQHRILRWKQKESWKKNQESCTSPPLFRWSVHPFFFFLSFWITSTMITAALLIPLLLLCRWVESACIHVHGFADKVAHSPISLSIGLPMAMRLDVLTLALIVAAACYGCRGALGDEIKCGANETE